MPDAVDSNLNITPPVKESKRILYKCLVLVMVLCLVVCSYIITIPVSINMSPQMSTLAGIIYQIAIAAVLVIVYCFYDPLEPGTQNLETDADTDVMMFNYSRMEFVGKLLCGNIAGWIFAWSGLPNTTDDEDLPTTILFGIFAVGSLAFTSPFIIGISFFQQRFPLHPTPVDDQYIGGTSV